VRSHVQWRIQVRVHAGTGGATLAANATVNVPSVVLVVNLLQRPVQSS